MRRSELQFEYPPELIATKKSRPSRILLTDRGQHPREILWSEKNEIFEPGDVLVLNDTKVEARRVFAGDQEILFTNRISENQWNVLMPAKSLEVGAVLNLPGGLKLTLEKKGLPQLVTVSKSIGEKYFQEFGEPALPPYIQKARGERHSRGEDLQSYQSAWAEKSGSAAAPTASLHFSQSDLRDFEQRGVEIHKITLHVGLGTFLPVKVDDLNEHVMHSEPVEIRKSTAAQLLAAKSEGRRIWSLGTTVTRALESLMNGALKEDDESYFGDTNIFIKPGYEFRLVDALMTNFHQPESTLLALVAAFAGLENVKSSYRFAIENKFKLFSYGDLSLWRNR